MKSIQLNTHLNEINSIKYTLKWNQLNTHLNEINSIKYTLKSHFLTFLATSFVSDYKKAK